MDITPSGQTLGASVAGINLAQPPNDDEVRVVLRALGEHGVLCFPRQTLVTDQLSGFGGRFGHVLVWDNIGTVHNAVGDYTAGEPHYMRRVQVMATLDYRRVMT